MSIWEGEDFLRCSSTLSSIPLAYVRCEVLAAEFMKIQNFLGYDAMSLVNRYRYLEEVVASILRDQGVQKSKKSSQNYWMLILGQHVPLKCW
jgi:hypothetical protein